MGTTVVLDCTGSNLGKFQLPAGALYAGYDTGSSGIAWTPAQYAAHPGTVHIDQDAAASDYTADVLDVERGAATPAECARWYQAALARFNAGSRPGQRHPSIYMSAASVTAVVNALAAAGVKSGPGLWVANWNLSDAAAVAEVLAAAGPFPVIGVQWRNAGLYDASVFSTAWLSAVSAAPHSPPPPPPVHASQYPVPAALSQTVQPIEVHFGWEPGTPLSPHWRYQVVHWLNGKPGVVVATDVVTSPHAVAVVPGPGTYAWRVQAAGDSPFTGWRVFTA